MFLRHRSAKSVELHQASPPSRLNRSRRAKVAKAVNYTVEALECRRLLTTITGGDTLTFNNEDGILQSVQAIGNITAEVVGANVDGDNNLHLINLPGQLNGVNINGGLAIPGAATAVGTTNIPVAGAAGNAQVPPGSLAVDPRTGFMYALVLETTPLPAPPVTHVYLVQYFPANIQTGAPGQFAFFPNAANAFDLSPLILGDVQAPPGSEVLSLPSMCFDPFGNAYFLAYTGSANGMMGATQPVENLFTAPLTALMGGAGLVGLPAGLVNTAMNLTSLDGLDFTAISWDLTAPAAPGANQGARLVGAAGTTGSPTIYNIDPTASPQPKLTNPGIDL